MSLTINGILFRPGVRDGGSPMSIAGHLVKHGGQQAADVDVVALAERIASALQVGNIYDSLPPRLELDVQLQLVAAKPSMHGSLTNRATNDAATMTALGHALGQAPASVRALDDGRLAVQLEPSDPVRFFFVTAEGEALEVGPYAFAATPDLVERLNEAGVFSVKAVDANGNGLITEDEIWSYFSFAVQQNADLYREIYASLAADHEEMRFLADGDLQEDSVSSTNRVDWPLYEKGAADIREYVTGMLKNVARIRGVDVAELSEIERFNAAAMAFGRLNVEFDELLPSDTGRPRRMVRLGLHRDTTNERQAGSFSPIEVFADNKTPALCLEQSYLFTVMLRAAGLKANITVVNSMDPEELEAFGTHNTVVVSVDGRRHFIEPQQVRYSSVGNERDWRNLTEATQRDRLGNAVTLHALKVEFGPSFAANDKEALAIAFSNAAWFDFYRVIYDESLDADGRRAIMARGREQVDVAMQMATRVIEIPGMDLLGRFAAAVAFPEEKTVELEGLVERADAFLAQPHWRDYERTWLLTMKAEALLVLGHDVGPVRGQLAALQARLPLKYAPFIAEPEVMRQALQTDRLPALKVE